MPDEPKKSDHRVQRGVSYHCLCGWHSATYFGEGARDQALAEWHLHRDKMKAEKKSSS